MPTIEQVRRERDRRGVAGRVRSWPRCRGALRHRLGTWRLRFWRDASLTRHLTKAQVRFDPPLSQRPCCPAAAHQEGSGE